MNLKTILEIVKIRPHTVMITICVIYLLFRVIIELSHVKVNIQHIGRS